MQRICSIKPFGATTTTAFSSRSPSDEDTDTDSSSTSSIIFASVEGTVVSAQLPPLQGGVHEKSPLATTAVLSRTVLARPPTTQTKFVVVRGSPNGTFIGALLQHNDQGEGAKDRAPSDDTESEAPSIELMILRQKSSQNGGSAESAGASEGIVQQQQRQEENEEDEDCQWVEVARVPVEQTASEFLWSPNSDQLVVYSDGRIDIFGLTVTTNQKEKTKNEKKNGNKKGTHPSSQTAAGTVRLEHIVGDDKVYPFFTKGGLLGAVDEDTDTMELWRLPDSLQITAPIGRKKLSIFDVAVVNQYILVLYSDYSVGINVVVAGQLTKVGLLKDLFPFDEENRASECDVALQVVGCDGEENTNTKKNVNSSRNQFFIGVTNSHAIHHVSLGGFSNTLGIVSGSLPKHHSCRSLHYVPAKEQDEGNDAPGDDCCGSLLAVCNIIPDSASSTEDAAEKEVESSGSMCIVAFQHPKTAAIDAALELAAATKASKLAARKEKKAAKAASSASASPTSPSAASDTPAVPMYIADSDDDSDGDDADVAEDTPSPRADLQMLRAASTLLEVPPTGPGGGKTRRKKSNGNSLLLGVVAACAAVAIGAAVYARQQKR